MSTITLSKEQIHKGNLILVNREYGIQPASEEPLAPASDATPEILLQRCAATLLNQLMQEIQGWHSIVPVSGWRSGEEQQQIWDNTLRESGLAFTEKYVAVPGHSEHQTGLAIDLGLKQEHIDFICPDFPDTGICRIFRQKAAKYGFILRYPAGKEKITGIGHEPWHFRYVGIPHAKIMEENELTLEEYMEFIRQYPHGAKAYRFQSGIQEIAVSFLSGRHCGCTFPDKADFPTLHVNTAPVSAVINLPDHHPYTVSGNNIDGFILTEWR